MWIYGGRIDSSPTRTDAYSPSFTWEEIDSPTGLHVVKSCEPGFNWCMWAYNHYVPDMI